MRVMGVYRKNEFFFLDNGLTDFEEQKICYGIKAGDVWKK